MRASALAEPPPEAPAEEPPSEEELLAQIAALDVRQLVLSTMLTLASLAHGKLAAGDREQARLAIDALAALLPLLGDGVDEQMVRGLRDTLAKLQIAFADGAPNGS